MSFIGGFRSPVGRRQWLSLIVAFGCGAAAFTSTAQPVNDNFSARAPIPGNDAAISGSLSNATSEVNEPSIDGASSGQTAWWTWTAPSNGIVVLSLNGSGFNPLVSVYAGGDLGSLSLVASNNYLSCYDNMQCGCVWRVRNQAAFHVSGGQVYQIALDSALMVDAAWLPQATPPASGPYILFGSYWVPTHTTNILAGSDVQMGWHFTPAPGNDDFENRRKLSGSRLHVLASNAGATRQAGEPDHLGNPGGSSVWFSWKAPASGRVTLSTNEIPPFEEPSSGGGSIGVIIIGIPPIGPPTCGSETDQNPPAAFRPLLAAYTGTAVDSLTSAGALPVSRNEFPNAVEFDVLKGHTYQIAFDGIQGTTGTMPLFLALTKPASNDRFSKRIRLHGIHAVATGFNAGATHETGEPDPAQGSSGKTVWWTWTAPVSGPVWIDLGPSDYPFPISVFTGSSLAQLQMIATSEGGVNFEAVGGQTYQIAVSDWAGLTGAIKLDLQAPTIEAELAQVLSRSPAMAVLRYNASPGQILLLQRLYPPYDDDWRNLATAVAHRHGVAFFVRPAPDDNNGPYYRAMIVDCISR